MSRASKRVVVSLPPAHPGGPSYLALVHRQRVSLSALTEWTRERTTDPRLPMLQVQAPAGIVRFWVVEVPQQEPALAAQPPLESGIYGIIRTQPKDAYVRSVTCAQVNLGPRGYAFESATEPHPDPDRGRRIALSRALEASGATRESRLALWAAFNTMFGPRGTKAPNGPTQKLPSPEECDRLLGRVGFPGQPPFSGSEHLS